jgi:hypothetical protein
LTAREVGAVPGLSSPGDATVAREGLGALEEGSEEELEPPQEISKTRRESKAEMRNNRFLPLIFCKIYTTLLVAKIARSFDATGCLGIVG